MICVIRGFHTELEFAQVREVAPLRLSHFFYFPDIHLLRIIFEHTFSLWNCFEHLPRKIYVYSTNNFNRMKYCLIGWYTDATKKRKERKRPNKIQKWLLFSGRVSIFVLLPIEKQGIHSTSICDMNAHEIPYYGYLSESVLFKSPSVQSHTVCCELYTTLCGIESFSFWYFFSVLLVPFAIYARASVGYALWLLFFDSRLHFQWQQKNIIE